MQPNLLKEVFADIERVAKTFDIDPQSVLAKLKQRIQEITTKTENIDPKPTVVALEWTEPLMGGGNWIPELVEM